MGHAAHAIPDEVAARPTRLPLGSTSDFVYRDVGTDNWCCW
jgi:hypothetical protein